MLHFMGSQRVGHNRATELNWRYRYTMSSMDIYSESKVRSVSSTSVTIILWLILLLYNNLEVLKL